MFSREDYIHGLCSHDDYYSQFVTEYYMNSVKKFTGDEPVAVWDRLPLLSKYTEKLMKKCNDYPTPAGRVCIYKAAFRAVQQLQCPELSSEVSSEVSPGRLETINA